VKYPNGISYANILTRFLPFVTGFNTNSQDLNPNTEKQKYQPLIELVFL